MASTRNATYKIYNGTDWDIYYFKTSAAQVGESATLKFLRPSTHTVNGKSFLNGTTHQGITLYGSDIKMSDATDAKTIQAAIEAIQADYITSDELVNYDYAVVNKNKNGLVPKTISTGCGSAGPAFAFLGYGVNGSGDLTPSWVTLPSTAFSDTNTWRRIYHNSTLLSAATDDSALNFVSGTGIKITGENVTGYSYKNIVISLDDSAFGNVKYAGLFNPITNEVTLSDDAGASTNLNMTLPTSSEIAEGGLDDNTYFIPAIGNYFIATADGTFDDISFVTGDWIIYNGTTNGWGKVDNTDAVTSVAGMTGNITASNLASALVPTLNNTYAAKSHNHDSVYAAKNHNHDGVYLSLTQQNTVTGDTWFNGELKASDLILAGSTFKINGGAIAITVPGKTGTLATLEDVTSSTHKIFTGSTTPTGMKSGDIWLEY